MLFYYPKALEKDVLQACLFTPCQSLAYSKTVCLCVRMRARACVCERDRDCEGFCVIVLSAEACREKGHVLSSDHIVYYNHNGGREIERRKGGR